MMTTTTTHDRDRDYYHDRGRDYPHDRDRDRHHKHRSQSRHRSHHSDRDRRHHKDDRKRHRGHRKHHTAPQVIVPPQMVAQYPGQVAPSAGYPYPGAHYDYRPSFGQRIRQFFGFAPASPHYQYKSDTHSWGFLGRSKRPRYIDARTGVEVDRHGRTVHRI
ncbi:hypothetical protein M378DRAFT_603611 [Amanita muscaria Koide BX008]|uniref:Uncharacterized protein n=1 Tax=Amanita muscaria (strain Koide BX008) TaxID=946122 RepID=A0A0C2T2Q4_AMAMK|nr:hypothetical protein M378DRAFT_603611 [Amanita muscaria Koide BX008]